MCPEVLSVNFEAFLNEMREAGEYPDRLVHLRDIPPREARYGRPSSPLSPGVQSFLQERGIEDLYIHQARALDLTRQDKDVLVTTGTASGKSLCYVVPVLEMLLRRNSGRALLVFPTKALCQDQFKSFRRALDAAGLDDVLAGVYDGDTPSRTRRRLRDAASVIFSNPDMLHASIMPHHGRWANFLADLRYLVLDEVHVYNGIFGSNMGNLMRRFWRVRQHYSNPDAPETRLIGCSATVANPGELAGRLTHRDVCVIDEDGSPRGRRVYAFWNPPRVRGARWRSRRSANVEAHELMAELVKADVPTITFSKARVTAEMIYRYVCEKLQDEAPHLVKKISPYRGGYRPHERREIEEQLFSGELLGVSTTPALELGIDVGGLDASIVVGYPGTLASFFQQSGRAGRQERDSLALLVGLDTAINQYIMSRPDYLFGRPVEEAVVESENPFVLLGHLRCAAHELPLSDSEAQDFGAHAPMVLDVLEENHKLQRVDGRWYHSAPETPQHELSMRYVYGENVLIEDVDSGEVIEEVDKIDAPPLVHPHAIYLRHGETWRVLDLDMERNIARVKKVDVDYYTQALGGSDVHHIDHQLREKPFGTGTAYWGEVTAYDITWGYEKIHFYQLDAISRHGLDLPRLSLDTMAFWVVPPEDLMEEVRQHGLNVHSGLRGIGYATRMLLPLFITCDTLDFSHSIGSVNSPWNAIFVYERYPHGMGFTEKAYERLHEILPAVLAQIRHCDCDEGCPCCVGKPLRKFDIWNVERGEGAVPSKESARRILEGLLADSGQLDCPDTHSVTDLEAADQQRLRQALRRRLETQREPEVFHRIEPEVETEYPEPVQESELEEPDVAARRRSRRSFHKKLDRRLARNIPDERLSPTKGKPGPPDKMKRGKGNNAPDAYPGKPKNWAVREAPEAPQRSTSPEMDAPQENSVEPIGQGDSLAARARRLEKKRRSADGDDDGES